jgi:hypothetical protein
MVHDLQVSAQLQRQKKQSLTWQSRAALEKGIPSNTRSKKTLKSCFLLGSNSTCRGHIASFHFEEYEKRCNAATPPITINFRCISETVVKAKKEAKKQMSLKFPSVKAPEEFTRGGIVSAVARHIACDDQVCFDGPILC